MAPKFAAKVLRPMHGHQPCVQQAPRSSQIRQQMPLFSGGSSLQVSREPVCLQLSSPLGCCDGIVFARIFRILSHTCHLSAVGPHHLIKLCLMFISPLISSLNSKKQLLMKIMFVALQHFRLDSRMCSTPTFPATAPSRFMEIQTVFHYLLGNCLHALASQELPARVPTQCNSIKMFCCILDSMMRLKWLRLIYIMMLCRDGKKNHGQGNQRGSQTREARGDK